MVILILIQLNQSQEKEFVLRQKMKLRSSEEKGGDYDGTVLSCSITNTYTNKGLDRKGIETFYHFWK